MTDNVVESADSSLFNRCIYDTKTRRPKKRFIVSVSFLSLAVVAFVYREDLMDLIDSCREIGFIGVVLYTCIFIAWSVFLLPQTPIEIAAGLIWKPLLKAVIIGEDLHGWRGVKCEVWIVGVSLLSPLSTCCLSKHAAITPNLSFFPTTPFPLSLPPSLFH